MSAPKLPNSRDFLADEGCRAGGSHLAPTHRKKIIFPRSPRQGGVSLRMAKLPWSAT